jgi:hypothetical protein
MMPSPEAHFVILSAHFVILSAHFVILSAAKDLRLQ